MLYCNFHIHHVPLTCVAIAYQHIAMERTVVINVVGLSKNLIGEHTPRLSAWVDDDATTYAPVKPVLPAVTTTVQSTYLTGKWPAEHGIVANGWYSREDCEVKFWKQSNKLVQGDKVWDHARRQNDNFTIANSFWWYNMYSSADYSVTPRPMYPADGRKLPDVYAHPPGLRDELQEKLGQFPLFNFWGPRTSRAASDWIAECAKELEERYQPSLHLVYIPHLDYCLMRTSVAAGDVAADLGEVDDIVMDLVDFFEAKSVRPIIVSEYGMSAVHRPVHINRALRKAGFISVRTELNRELLDAGSCRAFAVADHQLAHVYINDPSVSKDVLALLRNLDGVDRVLDRRAQREEHIDHERSGDLVVVSEPDAWFTYYYWEDDARAPDFARCVDIHRKPGFDPVELFIDPVLKFPTMYAGYKLLRKSLGFRYLLDVIPLDASLVQGSHGHCTKDPDRGALLLTKNPEHLEEYLQNGQLEPVDVLNVILRHLHMKPVEV